MIRSATRITLSPRCPMLATLNHEAKNRKDPTWFYSKHQNIYSINLGSFGQRTLATERFAIGKTRSSTRSGRSRTQNPFMKHLLPIQRDSGAREIDSFDEFLLSSSQLPLLNVTALIRWFFSVEERVENWVFIAADRIVSNQLEKETPIAYYNFHGGIRGGHCRASRRGRLILKNHEFFVTVDRESRGGGGTAIGTRTGRWNGYISPSGGVCNLDAL